MLHFSFNKNLLETNVKIILFFIFTLIEFDLSILSFLYLENNSILLDD